MGAILLDDHRKVPFFAVMVFAVVATWYVFFPVVFTRTAISDFHKFRLGEKYDRRGRPIGPESTDRLLEVEYGRTTNHALRRSVYAFETQARQDKYGGERVEPFKTVRLTRRKLDVILPAMFTAVWFVFAICLVSGSGSAGAAGDVRPMRNPPLLHPYCRPWDHGPQRDFCWYQPRP